MRIGAATAPLVVAAALYCSSALGVAGCVGDPGALPSKGSDTTEAGSTVEADAGQLSDPGRLLGDESSTTTDRGPAPLRDDGGATPEDPGEPDVAPVDCEAEPGAFGCPCKSGDDCNSGFCVPASQGGTICTTSCIDRCPRGWRCTLLQIGGHQVSPL